jgi:7-cyano-7-deazaguanine synthase in queuosine biosynthesis
MKAMVLFSGGIDSTTCLGMAVEKYGPENVIALSISYGQKHTKEIEASDKIVKYYNVFILTLQKYFNIVIVHYYHILIRKYLKNHMMSRLRAQMVLLFQHMFHLEMGYFYQVLPV